MQYNLLWIGPEIQLPLFLSVCVFSKERNFNVKINHQIAEIAQLGERQTEDLNVPSSIPGFGNMFIFLNPAKKFFQALQELVGQQSEKNQHFWRTFILVFWKTIRFPSLATMKHDINNAFFFVTYGKFSLFNFDYLLRSFQFLTKKFNISDVLYVTRCRTQNCREIIGSEERMR